MRSMGHSFALYAKDENRYLPYCNWRSLDSTFVKGWLYVQPNLTAASDVEDWTFLEYLFDRSIYHCPMHKDQVHKGNTQRLSSYLMTGLTQHYGSNTTWFYLSQFRGDGIVMWEANENRGHWNDGSHFIKEGSPQLSFRHFERANVLAISAGVEPWFSSEYDA